MKAVQVGDLVEYSWAGGKIDKGIVIETNIDQTHRVKVYWFTQIEPLYWENPNSKHFKVIQ